jgi:hypothetical protein
LEKEAIMKMRKTWSVVLAGLALSACGDFQGQGTETDNSQIIRATSNGGRNEVLMLFSVVVIDGQFFHRTCTGSYFAPRVVLTAAHCLEGTVGNEIFAYWGDNFAQDFSQLTPQGIGFIPPPIGSPSMFSKADSWQIHPSWDRVLIHPDMGVVFLDRKPPFDPLPLLRSRVGSGVNVTISGWGSNTAPTPTTGAGAQVQRTGTTRTVGSPTAADFHPDDPNPGMLNATVRQNVIKMDGRAPNSNGCFGDSGGPFIVRQFGQDYFAGVSYFTGLSCEDYSLYVRLDPFLPFLDLSYKRGGQDLLKPTFDCVAPNPRGTLTAYFGSRNDNGVAITIPHGSKNAAPRDTLNLRPTRFLPGVQTFTAPIDFPQGQSAAWTLSPDNNPTTTVTANANSLRCPTDQFIVQADNACRAIVRSGCPQAGTFPNCFQFHQSFGLLVTYYFPQCVGAFNTFLSCTAATPPGTTRWSCGVGDGETKALNCADEETAMFQCFYPPQP